MQIELWSGFSKKDNSTRQPVAGATVVKHTVTGVLKEPCSILRPHVTLQALPVASTIPSVCTYAYISEFSRYYFIQDWEWQDGLWTVTMLEDHLASWKTVIGAQSEYILRADSLTISDGTISDSTYPATTAFTCRETILLNTFTDVISSGTYVVGIIGKTTAASVGAVNYYGMTGSQFAAFRDYLFSDNCMELMGLIDSAGAATYADYPPEVLKVQYNPYQYVVSCVWLPIPISGFSAATDYIALGWWTLPIYAYRLNAQILDTFWEEGSLHDHPQASTRGIYLNYAPYTRRSIVGRFGTIAIDSSYFSTGSLLRVKYAVDVVTGNCMVSVQAVTTSGGVQRVVTLSERAMTLGTPIQLAQMGTNYLGTAMAAVNAVGGLVGNLATGNISGAISSAVSGAADAVTQAIPQMETSGSNGSFLNSMVETRIVEQYYTVVPEDRTHIGRPVCSIHRINTLSGYVKCAEGDIDIDCFDEERTRIREYMTAGFFWE